MLDRNAKVLIAGHAWFLWSSVARKFRNSWFRNLLLVDRAELDLSDAWAVSAFFETERPEVVVLCAAKVGGVAAHAAGQYSMLHDNLVIQNSVIDAAYRHGVSKLLFVSSGTVYPNVCEQPIPESAMFGGPFDPLHESYALAKIAWMKLCEKARSESWRDFFSLVPTNMYWEGDTFEDGRSNVVCSLMKRFHEARETGKSEVVVWGTGNALRDFLYVDDMADAILHFLENPPDVPYLNIGSDQEVSISQLAKSIGKLSNFTWDIVFDSSKPEGRLRRKLDSSLANSLGWKPSVPLSDWLAKTLDFYMSTINR